MAGTRGSIVSGEPFIVVLDVASNYSVIYIATPDGDLALFSGGILNGVIQDSNTDIWVVGWATGSSLSSWSMGLLATGIVA